ncbi:target of Nesh-SH3-like isoform X6 [Poecilia latipinna]|uniref:target of Nesh-SH3-like isoform X6 n=1 Tax=Poecilia latipinna TaxID=48699 RepID=UPI00072D9EBC|nr:PREDICTED: target of Nesh-SH3-like isoform X6 [Poecilia latipinna]
MPWQNSHCFLLLFLTAFLIGTALSLPSTSHRRRVRRQNMKVRISASGDTIVMKFLHPNTDTKLEGYILGYGSSMFSKQFIQLPENGQPYETEFDAEPKYLVAVQPIPANEVKKQCKGKVELQKPLHLVIGSVTPTSVLLSWGMLLKTPFEGNVMNDCLEDGHYTVRYREKNRKWNYQTCPTSDTVIDNLKPHAVYEFGVQPNSKDGAGAWSKPVLHNVSTAGIQEKVIRRILKYPISPVKTFTPAPPSFQFPLQHASKNRTRTRVFTSRIKTPQTTPAPTTAAKQKILPTPGPKLPVINKQPIGSGSTRSSTAEVPHSPISSSVPTGGRNATVIRNRDPSHSSNPGVRSFSPSKTATSSRTSNTPGAANGAHHRGNALPKPDAWSREKPVQRPPVPGNKRPNLVGKTSDHDKPMDLKQRDKESTLKSFLPVTPKPKPKHQQQQTTTVVPVVNSSRYDLNENSSIFSSMPASEVDIMGKKRFIAPHVIYKTDKKPDEPCSITSSMAYFPDEEGSDVNVTGPPRTPPSNLTVVTVEGCPSFVILDWEKSDNETREYEVVSTTTGPNGQEVSILTTNQTHTAVENLTPDSSYEFTVTPKNELGVGPSSDPVTFNTESADPRVSEQASGKDAIWTQFPFKSDAYSECNGKQYIKRTWYRKFVGIQLCNSLRYKIYLSDSLNGKFYNIGDQTGYGEDHCQFVDSFLDGRTGTQMLADQLPTRQGFFRALRQEPVSFGQIGGKSHVTYVGWYECGTPIPGKW